MQTLDLPADLPFPGVVTALADDDAMFDGRHEHYVRVGRSADQAIRRALHEAPAPRRTLDMPCGHGRVTRMLRARYPRASIIVCWREARPFCAPAATYDARLGQ